METTNKPFHSNILRRYTLKILSFFLMLFIGCVVSILLGYNSSVHAAGSQPLLGLPYASGTPNVGLGQSGLHGCNYASVPGYSFSNSNSGCDSSPITDASLDIGFYTTGTSSVPVYALGSGTVLNYWSTCRTVLIDYGNGWWGYYIHLTNVQVSSGSSVNTGTIIGYPTTSVVTGSPCYEYSSFEHVHFAFFNSTGSTTATYVSMAGMTLCGSTVLSNASAPHQGSGTIDNLQGLTSTFTVPSCPGVSNTSTLDVTQNPSNVATISVSSNPVNYGASGFSAKVYVGNVITSGSGQALSYYGLRLLATGPNGYTCVLRSDPGFWTLYPGQGGELDYTPSSFMSGCPSYPPAGTYQLHEQVQLSSGGQFTDLAATNGGTNPQSLTVFVASPITSIKRVNSTSTNGTIEIFSINSQGNVMANSECSSCQGGWTGWSSITPSPALFTGKVSATINSAAQVTIFARDRSGNIWFISECNSNSGCPSGWAWEGWNELPNFQSPYDPTAFDYDSNNDMEVMVNGSDQTVYYDYYNGSWSGWNHISNAKAFATNVQVGIYQSSSTNIFALDSSGTIWGSWTSYGNPNGWSSWNNFGSVFYTNASPIRYDSAGDLDLFAQSNLNVVGNDPVVNGSWQGFSQTTANPSGISFTGMIAGGIDPGNNAEIFTKDTSTGAIWHQWGLPGSWSAWQSLGGHAVADPAVTAHSDKTLDVFLFNNDGSIWYNQQCNCNPTWPGWVSLGPIW